MTDDEIRALHQRLAKIMEEAGDAPDHYYACVLLADFSCIPFHRIFEVCADL